MPNSPNILFFCVEHLRYDMIHALGNSIACTPNIDKLVQSGVSFTNAYAQSPVCMPSRASFMSGRYPINTGVYRNGQDYQADTATPLFSGDLVKHGYTCGLAGKLHVRHAYFGPEQRTEDGFDMFKYSHGVANGFGCDYEDWLKEQGLELDDAYKKGVLNSRRVTKDKLHQTTWCVNNAKQFIEANSNKPWLTMVQPFAVHDPYDYLDKYYKNYNPKDMVAPELSNYEREGLTEAQKKKLKASGFDKRGFDETTKLERQEMIAAYYACLEHLDAQLGRLLNTLEDTNQLDNTLIIFTADHGDLLGEHGIFAKGPFFYDPLVRVPLIFSMPGKLPQNYRCSDMVELVDIAPTIFDILGLEIPKQYQGNSLLNVISNTDKKPRRDGVLSSHYAHDQKDGSATMWRNEQYKIVVRHSQKQGELYDMQNDPNEIHNLWAVEEYKDIQAQLTQRCFDELIKRLDTCAVDGAIF